MRIAKSLSLLPALFLTPYAGCAAQDSISADEILAKAIEAAGGELWASPRTLTLSGHAVFYGDAGEKPRAHSDDYRMWREFDGDRTISHGAEGKVRIIAKSGEKLIFEVGYDGETTWTERGITPKKEADKFWASSFGFGIIRSARNSGFVANRIADDYIGPYKLYMVELVDPNGGRTLFGIDQKSHAIRKMGFRTPRGWHVRVYDDFYKLDNGWVQPRHVTLYYDGRKSNEVFWTDVRVNTNIPEEVFAAPGK